MTVHSCLGRWFVDGRRSTVIERSASHETVLEQTEQEEVKCTDEIQPESDVNSKEKARTMETANPSETTADPADLYSACAAKSHKDAFAKGTNFSAGAEERPTKTSDCEKRLHENLSQAYGALEVLGYLD